MHISPLNKSPIWLGQNATCIPHMHLSLQWREAPPSRHPCSSVSSPLVYTHSHLCFTHAFRNERYHITLPFYLLILPHLLQLDLPFLSQGILQAITMVDPLLAMHIAIF